nr:putative reverse transcriptase domain-containing protein [Tanacetum cinerariifolium]
MEGYIRFEEEKAPKCGKVFNWETTKYGKIWLRVQDSSPYLQIHGISMSLLVGSPVILVGYVSSTASVVVVELEANKGVHYKEFRELILPFNDQKRVSQLVRKLLKIAALADLGASVSVMPDSTYTTLGLGDLIPTKLVVELANRIVKRPEGIVENVLVDIDKFTLPVDFIILDILKDFKTPLILGRPFLSIAHAIINVFKAKITLSVGNDKIFFKSNKPTSNIIKRVYALSLIKSTKLDLEARQMGNALRKNRSHDLKFEDLLKLNDLNKPLELRHDQVVDLGSTIEEGEVIDAPIKEMVKLGMIMIRSPTELRIILVLTTLIGRLMSMVLTI